MLFLDECIYEFDIGAYILGKGDIALLEKISPSPVQILPGVDVFKQDCRRKIVNTNHYINVNPVPYTPAADKFITISGKTRNYS